MAERETRQASKRRAIGQRASTLLGRLGSGVAKRPRLVLMLTLLVLLVSVALASRLRLDTDLLSLVSGEDPAVAEFLTTTERFGSLDRLLIVLHLPADSGAAREPYFELADRLAAGLEELDTVDRVDHKVPELGDLTRQLMPYAALLVAPEDVDALADRLSEQGLAGAAESTRRRLTSPESLFARSRIQSDPFDLLPLLAGRFEVSASSELVDPTSGYFISPDGALLLLDVRATGPAHDVPFARRLIAQTQELIDRELAAARERLPEDERAGFEPRPGLAGGYALAAADVERVQIDLARNTAFALIAVSVLFLLAFRRFVAFWLALVPLVVGLALTMGMAAVTIGRLSSLTSSITALLVGLGVDFTIVLLERYGEERRRGKSQSEASAVMLGSTGRGVVIGALTTAVTFFAFLICDFKGLREQGFLTGGGILLCLVATFVLLPALLALTDREEHVVALRMRSFGSQFLVALSRRRPGLVIGLWGLILAACALGLPFLRYEDNLKSLRSADHEVMRTQSEITEAFGFSPNRMMMRLDGDDPAELLADTRTVRREIQPLLDDGTLVSVLSLADLVPPQDEQREVLAALRAGAADRFSPERVAADGRAALAAAGLNPAAFESAIDGLAQALSPPGPIDLAVLTGTDLGVYLDRLLVPTEEGWSMAIYLVPPPDLYRSEAPPELIAISERTGAPLVGLNTVSESLRRQTWRDLDVVAPVALIAVWILLILDFRSWRLGSLAFLPVGPGLVLMLGLAGWLGIALSLMNLFVIVLVFGIGVDYGVHMMHRYREARAGGRDVERGLAETSKAVLLAALTTAFGFGSLALSGFAGLRSVGWLSVFGAIGSGFAALTLLPAILAWTAQRKERREGSEQPPA